MLETDRELSRIAGSRGCMTSHAMKMIKHSMKKNITTINVNRGTKEELFLDPTGGVASEGEERI